MSFTMGTMSGINGVSFEEAIPNDACMPAQWMSRFGVGALTGVQKLALAVIETARLSIESGTPREVRDDWRWFNEKRDVEGVTFEMACGLIPALNPDAIRAAIWREHRERIIASRKPPSPIKVARPSRPLRHCGNPKCERVLEHRAPSQNLKYCSAECYYIVRATERGREYVARGPGKPRPCAWCHVDFTPEGTQTKRYCSDEHRREAHRSTWRKAKRRQWRRKTAPVVAGGVA